MMLLLLLLQQLLTGCAGRLLLLLLPLLLKTSGPWRKDAAFCYYSCWVPVAFRSRIAYNRFRVLLSTYTTYYPSRVCSWSDLLCIQNERVNFLQIVFFTYK